MKHPLIFTAHLLVIVLLIQGCSMRSAEISEAPQAFAEAWKGYAARATAAELNTGPFRINANLRYSYKKESHRVASFLWGNGDFLTPYPIRLDLVAGVGTVIAKIRESEEQFLAYNPDEGLAYVNPRGSMTLVSFGVPIPFTLSDLVLLLTGRNASLLVSDLPAEYSTLPEEQEKTPEGFAFFLPDAPLPGKLELSVSGVPLSWRDPAGWLIEFTPSEFEPLRPKKLRITHPDGHLAIIVIKNIEYMSHAYTPEQLGLDLSQETRYVLLEDI